jgi:hypothetical protein
MNYLDSLASVASITTAVIATYAYGNYRWTVHRRMRALEDVLERKNRPGDDCLSLRELAAAINATDDQVIEAASKSKKVRSTAGRLGDEHRFTMTRKSNQDTTPSPARR